MNFLKSHFWYNKNQRNGILFLILLLFFFQAVYIFMPSSSDEIVDVQTPKFLAFQKQIDSLKAIEIEKRKPKVFPFNPNFITDFKGSRLGMSVAEIDRLVAFRKKGKFVNSVKEFQRVTKVSDSLLAKISPFFKFPDWVTKRDSNVTSSGVEQFYKKKKWVVARSRSTTNLNKATAEDLQTISGIGNYFSEKIIDYRNRLQGFTFKEQLYEVWKLDKEVADKVLGVFTISEKPTIKKININTATFKEVLKNPYIDYKLCKKIFEYRDEVAELQSINQLKNIDQFPLDKYERIILYLEAK